MSLIERVLSENASSFFTESADGAFPRAKGRADTPVYLVTMYKGIGDAVAVGLSAIDQIMRNDPSAGGKIDALFDHISSQQLTEEIIK